MGTDANWPAVLIITITGPTHHLAASNRLSRGPPESLSGQQEQEVKSRQHEGEGAGHHFGHRGRAWLQDVIGRHFIVVAGTLPTTLLLLQWRLTCCRHRVLSITGQGGAFLPPLAGTYCDTTSCCL